MCSARKLSQMTEKMSKAMLDGVGVATGSIMGPMVRSQAGKKFLSMVPGEVLLASLDAVNKVLDAAEAAERQAFSATSGAVTKMVSQRFGENAGEATQDALATAGHTVGTAWNVFKIRKVITPGSSVTSGVRNAAKNSTR
nr:senescence/dehydration-associated protein At4g35985, chloroplastic-like [Ipomoea batatas]